VSAQHPRNGTDMERSRARGRGARPFAHAACAHRALILAVSIAQRSSLCSFSTCEPSLSRHREREGHRGRSNAHPQESTAEPDTVASDDPRLEGQELRDVTSISDVSCNAHSAYMEAMRIPTTHFNELCQNGPCKHPRSVVCSSCISDRCLAYCRPYFLSSCSLAHLANIPGNISFSRPLCCSRTLPAEGSCCSLLAGASPGLPAHRSFNSRSTSSGRLPGSRRLLCTRLWTEPSHQGVLGGSPGAGRAVCGGSGVKLRRPALGRSTRALRARHSSLQLGRPTESRLGSEAAETCSRVGARSEQWH